MAILTTVFFFFTIQALTLMTSVKADPQMEVHPSEISLGLSLSLDINCSFSVVDHPEMAAFVSLILSRANSSDQAFENLAAITEFSPDSVSLLTQEKVLATGIHSQEGQSYLHLKWDLPTASQGGVYKCTSRGVDTLGQPIESVNVFTVAVAEANLNDVFEKLQQMKIHQTAMENTNAEMENTIAGLKKHIQALEYNNSLLSSSVTDLQDIVAYQQSLHRSQLDLLGSYENHDYYVSKNSYHDINNTIIACKSSGGYLVEIDNESEFNAIQKFLNDTIIFERVVIAGTDKTSDGTWIFQSNGKPLPFTNWHDSESSIGTNENCLMVYRGGSWKMDDYYCEVGLTTTKDRYMCEVVA